MSAACAASTARPPPIGIRPLFADASTERSRHVAQMCEVSTARVSRVLAAGGAFPSRVARPSMEVGRSRSGSQERQTAISLVSVDDLVVDDDHATV